MTKTPDLKNKNQNKTYPFFRSNNFLPLNSAEITACRQIVLEMEPSVRAPRGSMLRCFLRFLHSLSAEQRRKYFPNSDNTPEPKPSEKSPEYLINQVRILWNDFKE
jgi:hypothetical protein